MSAAHHKVAAIACSHAAHTVAPHMFQGVSYETLTPHKVGKDAEEEDEGACMM